MFKSLIISKLTGFAKICVNMRIRDNKPYRALIINTLDNISKFSKCRKDFICEVIILFLSIKGRINFLQPGRFGNFEEQRYRQQFEKPFLDFNKDLALAHLPMFFYSLITFLKFFVICPLQKGVPMYLISFFSFINNEFSINHFGIPIFLSINT